MTEEDIEAAFETWVRTNTAQPRSAFRAGAEFGLRHQTSQSDAVPDSDGVTRMEAEDNRRGSKAMNKTGLVDQVQMTLKTFRSTARSHPRGMSLEPEFRELAVSVVRVFHEFIGEELTRPDQYDGEQPSKGQGWE